MLLLVFFFFSFLFFFFFFFFNDTATTEIYTLSLHDALPTPRRTGDDRVAHVKGALHDQRGHDGTATGVEVRLEDRGPGQTLRIGDELLDDLDVGDEQDRAEQLLDAEPNRRRDVDD